VPPSAPSSSSSSSSPSSSSSSLLGQSGRGRGQCTQRNGDKRRRRKTAKYLRISFDFRAGRRHRRSGATQAGSTCIPIVTHPHRHIVAPGCTSVSAGLRWLLLQLRFKYVSSCGSGTPPQRGITYRSLGSVFGFRLPRCAVRGLEIFVNEGNLRKILSRISIRLTFSYVAHAVLCGMRRESGFLCVLISIFASRISETKRRKLNAKTAYGISSFSVFCLSTLLYG